MYASLQNRGKSPVRLALPQHMHFVTPSLSKARVMCPCWLSLTSTSSSPTCLNKCPLLNSSHFTSFFCFWCVPLLDLVSTFLQLCFHRAWSLPWHVGFALSVFFPDAVSCIHFVTLPLQSLQLWEDPQTSCRRPVPTRAPSFLRSLLNIAICIHICLGICPLCLWTPMPLTMA